MRRFVISDIHGNYKGLKQCLEKVNFDYEKDLLIVNGDVCDGFPEVNLCIDELLKIKNIEATLGNHDYWVINWAKSDFTVLDPLWYNQGGKGTVMSYKDYPLGHMPWEHIQFLTKMKKYISFDEGKQDEIVFVHAGIDPNQKNMQKQDLNICIWDRQLMNSAWKKHKRKPDYKFAGKKRIFIGHTTTEVFHKTEPILLCNIVCGDTGGGMSGKLSIINIDTLEYEQSDLATKLYSDFKPRY